MSYGIFTFTIYHKSKPNVGKYSSPMGHFGFFLGVGSVGFQNRPNISQEDHGGYLLPRFNAGKFSGKS